METHGSLCYVVCTINRRYYTHTNTHAHTCCVHSISSLAHCSKSNVACYAKSMWYVNAALSVWRFACFIVVVVVILFDSILMLRFFFAIVGGLLDGLRQQISLGTLLLTLRMGQVYARNDLYQVDKCCGQAKLRPNSEKQ